jgi:hypothetical protein
MLRNHSYLRYPSNEHSNTDSTIQLLTGGDDNAIHLTKIVLHPELSCVPIASVLSAHTSTVTGVLSLGNSRFMSVGIDQNIKIWEFNGENLLCRGSGYTFVPDVCGIIEIGVSDGKRRFVIFGTGMELIAWKDGKVGDTNS